MRLYEIDNTTNDSTVEEIANVISEKCAPFLKESKGVPLLRGVPWDYGDELGDSFFHFEYRKNRGPKKAKPEFFYYIDNAMIQAGLKATRSNSDLFTGDYNTANLYSDWESSMDIAACFPVGGFIYSYNPNVHDYLDDMLQLDRKFYKPYLHGEPEVAAERWWEKIGNGYKTTDLDVALKSNVEIMITGDQGYYAMPIDIAEDVYKVLGK